MNSYKPAANRHNLRPYQHDLIREAANLELGRNFSTYYLCLPPGGGKTATAVEIAVQEFLSKGHKVLWLAWDWILLDQAYDSLKRQYEIPSDRIGFAIKSSPRGVPFVRNSVCPNVLRGEAPASQIDLLFTTPRVLVNNLSELRGFKPSIIVHDEAHWGISGKTEQNFRKYYKARGISVLGLSGTPKKRATWDLIEPLVSFRRLVLDGWLSEPIPYSIKSNRTYEGRLIGDEEGRGGKMISPATIRELTEDRRRNQEIVSYISTNARRLGKTIVFAGNKDHADRLGNMLGSLGAVTIHEDVDDPKEKIQEFKSNNHRIAVCVNMLRQGIDVPDVNTIVITTPTTSDIAYFQMACRGARTTPTKNTFNLIDVTDTFNNANFRDLLVKPTAFFSGAGANRDIEITDATYLGKSHGATRRAVQNRSSRKHDYTYATSTFELKYTDHDPIYLQRLNGLRINRTQTFGVECELTHTDKNFAYDERDMWEPIAERLLYEIREAVGAKNCAKAPLFTDSEKANINYELWNLVHDGSCGWEIVSPILIGAEGFEDIALLFHELESREVLKSLSLAVNYSTGLHVHLGWNYVDIQQTKRLVKAIRKFSPAFYTLVASSRLNNRYCRPVKSYLSRAKMSAITSMTDFKRHWQEHESRYHDVNFQGVRRADQTLEVRLHSGTHDGTKIALWISLWMNLLYATDRQENPLQVDDDDIGQSLDFEKNDSSDIIQVCTKYLGILPSPSSASSRGDFSGFLQKLHHRRLEIFSNEHWRKAIGAKKVSSLLDYWDQEFRKAQS